MGVSFYYIQGSQDPPPPRKHIIHKTIIWSMKWGKIRSLWKKFKELEKGAIIIAYPLQYWEIELSCNYIAKCQNTTN